MLDLSKCQAYLATVRAFADSVGGRESLEQQLAYLDTYGEHGDVGRTKCVLMPEFMGNGRSFDFVIQYRTDRPTEDGTGFEYEHGMHGGLVYSGPNQPHNGSAPGYTVSNDPDVAAGRTPRWTVNT